MFLPDDPPRNARGDPPRAPLRFKSYHLKKESGRPDLNRGPLGPEPSTAIFPVVSLGASCCLLLSPGTTLRQRGFWRCVSWCSLLPLGTACSSIRTVSGNPSLKLKTSFFTCPVTKRSNHEFTRSTSHPRPTGGVTAHTMAAPPPLSRTYGNVFFFLIIYYSFWIPIFCH